MATITIDASRIVDAESFHCMFAEAMGFPGWYGNNLDAWVDVMSSLTEAEPMSRFRLDDDELRIHVVGFEDFLARDEGLARALLSCTADVNRRYAARGENARIALVLE